MNNNNDNIIGNLPENINKEIPTPNSNAESISKLIKESGEVVGYELSSGERISKEQAISLAKSGGILDIAVATRNGEEYLRTLPDGKDGNNLSSLPTIGK